MWSSISSVDRKFIEKSENSINFWERRVLRPEKSLSYQPWCTIPSSWVILCDKTGSNVKIEKGKFLKNDLNFDLLRASLPWYLSRKSDHKYLSKQIIVEFRLFNVIVLFPTKHFFSSHMSSHLIWCMTWANKVFFVIFQNISSQTPLSKQILWTLTLSSDRNCRSEIVTFITWAGVVTTYWVKVLLIHCWNWVIYYRVASHKEMMISSWANAP